MKRRTPTPPRSSEPNPQNITPLHTEDTMKKPNPNPTSRPGIIILSQPHKKKTLIICYHSHQEERYGGWGSNPNPREDTSQTFTYMIHQISFKPSSSHPASNQHPTTQKRNPKTPKSQRRGDHTSDREYNAIVWGEVSYS